MGALKPAFTTWIGRFFSRLRFPTLFAVTAVLFVANVLWPDAIPLIDEILLAAATAVLANWRKPERSDSPANEPGRRSSP